MDGREKEEIRKSISSQRHRDNRESLTPVVLNQNNFVYNIWQTCRYGSWSRVGGRTHLKSSEWGQ